MRDPSHAQGALYSYLRPEQSGLFPALVEIVQQHVVRMSKEEQLDQLTKIIALAPDEKTARWAINTLAA